MKKKKSCYLVSHWLPLKQSPRPAPNVRRRHFAKLLSGAFTSLSRRSSLPSQHQAIESREGFTLQFWGHHGLYSCGGFLTHWGTPMTMEILMFHPHRDFEVWFLRERRAMKAPSTPTSWCPTSWSLCPPGAEFQMTCRFSSNRTWSSFQDSKQFPGSSSSVGLVVPPLNVSSIFPTQFPNRSWGSSRTPRVSRPWRPMCRTCSNSGESTVMVGNPWMP